MLLSELIPQADAVLDLRVADKGRALKEIASRLAARAGVPAARIERALTAREALGSTGVGRGIALPHARVAGARATCAVFVRLARPIDFAAVDGQPVDLLCGIVAPDQPRPEALAALAAVSRALRDPSLVTRLRAAGSRESLHALLVAADPAPATA